MQSDSAIQFIYLTGYVIFQKLVIKIKIKFKYRTIYEY